LPEQPKDPCAGKFIHEAVPAAATAGEMVREGHDYSAILRRLALLKAVKPSVPPPPKKLK